MSSKMKKFFFKKKNKSGENFTNSNKNKQNISKKIKYLTRVSITFFTILKMRNKVSSRVLNV